jgi:hypothetical protein
MKGHDMELNTIFPSKYLKADDLKGREPTVVIASAEIEKLGNDSKLVLYFQGKEKGLVCNRTNADSIAYLYGTNTDGWIGKEIVLCTQMVSFQGKVGPAIRIRPPTARGNGKHVVTERQGYATSEMRRPDPIEETTGHPTRDDADF